MFFRKVFLLLFILIDCLTVRAAYTIKGTVNLSPDWQRQIFLATINKLDDYYKANPADIIQVAYIQEDGSFTMTGDNLPLEPRFYRLYLIKEENSEFDACLYVGGDDHNFIHLVMDNTTQLEITADANHTALFGNYSVLGDATNNLMQQLGRIIYPSYYFYQIKFPSELQFSQKKLNRDLFEFADTCQNTIVALAAIINTDIDQYFELETERYQHFSDRLQKDFSKHNYTKDYYRKLNYYKEIPTYNTIPTWMIGLVTILGLLLLALLWKIATLRKELAQVKLLLTNQATHTPPAPSFTNQEEKILHLIRAGKSNKEIAEALFIELSTVKSHINKLYSKLGVTNRKEAKKVRMKREE